MVDCVEEDAYATDKCREGTGEEGGEGEGG